MGNLFLTIELTQLVGFTKLHMGLVVFVKKILVLIFYCKIPILCQSLAKSSQILLVMSDRTDTFCELGARFHCILSTYWHGKMQ